MQYSESIRRLSIWHFVPASFLLLFGISALHAQSDTDLKPRNGVDGVLAAFDHAKIVGIPDPHWSANYSNFRIRVIQHPEFPNKAQDIVIEWGNSLYQDVLDRYLSGNEVSKSKLRQVWRNTTIINGTWDSRVYEEFLVAVRAVNQKLPKSKRLRVLAGDPPIDWSKVKSRDDYNAFRSSRDESYASVIEKQVLSKGHKALLILGSGHLLRDGWARNVAVLLDEKHPGDLFAILPPYFPDRDKAAGDPYSPATQLAQKLSALPQPSFFLFKHTWLGSQPLRDLGDYYAVVAAARGKSWVDAVKAKKLQDVVDGYLNLDYGKRIGADPSVYQNPEYLRELNRRWQIVFGAAFKPPN
jgi:hypothetical protein